MEAEDVGMGSVREQYNRVILNSQIQVRRGRGAGMVRA